MQLNQLYGYFGRSQELIITQNVGEEELHKILLTKIVSNVIQINKDNYLVLLKGNLNEKLIDKLKLKLDLTDFKQISKTVKSNVAISAAVTAYGQIEMMKYKTLSDYNIFYTDTDSIFIDKPLPDSMVNNEIGQMKNELKTLKTNIIDLACFLGNKKYGLSYTDYDGKIQHLTVFAGAKRDSLTFNEIMLMSQGKTVHKLYDDVFFKDFRKMEITIKPRELDLKMSTSKNLFNNFYETPKIYNSFNIFDTQSKINKITNKCKLFIKKFISKI